MKQDEADLVAYFGRPALLQALDHLGDAFFNVRDLPEFASDESWLAHSTLTAPALFGCRSAFYVSARSIAEFFVRMPPKDYTALDYLPTWKPRRALAQRLQRVWLGTSKHVVHFSRDRVPVSAEAFEPWDTSFRALRAIGRDCWTILAEFAGDYSEADGKYAEQFTAMRDGFRPTAVGTHASWEREKRERFRRAVVVINTPLVARRADGSPKT